jgi:UPF0755 protein
MNGLTRLLSGILTLLFVVTLGLAGGLAWFEQAMRSEGPLTEKRIIAIPAGDSTYMIAERLEEQGAISSQTLFLAKFMSDNVIARYAGRGERHLKAGEYEIEAGASVNKIIAKLTEGRSLLYSVTLPEGLTSHEIVRRLLNDQNLSGEVTEIPAEGSLMPETFKVPRNTSRAQVLALLRREQEKFLEAQWEARAPNLPFSTKHEALVLASIVEKESGPRDDPADVAGVFVNRLRKAMRLQSDPTILYGKHGPDVDWGAKIYRSDINKKTAYNTYQISGLPPTPICNPGRRAIAAVLRPAKTENLYFVADGRGGHIYSKTLQEHEQAVRQWRRIEREINAESKARAAVKSADVAPTLINTKGGGITVSRDAEGGAGLVPLPVRRPSR